nr:MAG TPA: hypothetical protein [Caudoviricetes sp.]
MFKYELFDIIYNTKINILLMSPGNVSGGH